MRKTGLAVVLAPLVASLASLVACSAPRPIPETPPASAAAAPAAAHFLHDDLPGALALAAQSNRPLFVEVEAPW